MLSDSIHTQRQILIVGASARAAAFSAIRAGLLPSCLDLFADQDLRQATTVERVADYADNAEAAARRLPPMPWLYTGAVENHPALVARLSTERPLWGIGGEALRQARDAQCVAKMLHAAGLPNCEVCESAAGLSDDGTWLRKPRRSAGGQGIAPHDLRDEFRRQEADYYWQRRMPGTPSAAVFIGTARGAIPLGVTRQLIGGGHLAEPGFHYHGSLGPLMISQQLTAQIAAIGDLLTNRLGLRGIFGVDGMLHNENFYTVEINPRYVASVEVLERGWQIDAMQLHAAVFVDAQETAVPRNLLTGAPQFNGKQIVFATHDARVSQRFTDWCVAQNRDCRWPRVADIPTPGQLLNSGNPVATVFAGGDDDTCIAHKLALRRLDMLEQLVALS